MTDSVIASWERKYAALLAEYGDGVRPSWVSAELARIGADIEHRRAQLEQESKAPGGVREEPRG